MLSLSVHAVSRVGSSQLNVPQPVLAQRTPSIGMDVRTQPSKLRAGFGVTPTSFGPPALPLTYSVILGKKLHRVL